MRIDEAKSGEDCLAKMEKHSYDLVFLDYRMPKMDGIETLERIRKQYPDAAPSTPIIALTACAVAGERERLLEVGFTDYASKPINVPELNDILLRYLPFEKVLSKSNAVKSAESSDDFVLPQAIYNISWLNPDEGIEYCGNGRLYLAALDKYADDIEEKAKRIKEYADKENWELFTITVHSLKSVSKAIGAERFSDRARELEIAAKEGEYQWVRDNVISFLEQYRSFFRDLQGAIQDP